MNIEVNKSLLNNKNETSEKLINIIKKNSAEDCLKKMQEYIRDNLENKSIDDYSQLLDELVIMITKISDFEFLNKYNETHLLPLINFFKSLILKNNSEFKKKILKILHENNIIGLNRFIRYDVEDNFERLYLTIIVANLYNLQYALVDQKSSIFSGALVLFLNTISKKMIIITKKKDLEVINNFLIKDFIKIQQNIINKIKNREDKKKYDSILKSYYLNNINLWTHYNNILSLFFYFISSIIQLEISPFRYNLSYNFFDYICINIYIFIVFNSTILFINKFQKNDNDYIKYKNIIENKLTDLINNFNIINEKNTFQLETNSIINYISKLIDEKYDKGIHIHASINKRRKKLRDKQIFLKYLLFLISTFQPAISAQIYVIEASLEDLLSVINNIETLLLENQIYEEILKYKIIEENDDPLFIEESNILFKIDNLSHSFGDNKIFKNVSIVIPKNKWLCFYGNSGCGKSTLCNILLRKLDPDQGTISYMGKYNNYTYSNIRKFISYVNTDQDLFNQSILYNITYGLKNPEDKKVLLKIQHYLKIFKLEKYKDKLETNVYALSTGEKQRMKIIRLILHDTKIWILDEITSNVDNDLEKTILNEIKRIQIKKNKSVIHITHNLENISFSDSKMYIKNFNIFNV
jgi:energy-coupling factor transport system ATP-binding protein